MRQLLLGTAAAVALLSAPALAADLPESQTVTVMDTVPVGIFSWSGAYAGANVGGAWGNSKWNVSPTGDHVSHSMNSFVGGLQLGYQYQFAGGFLAGVEGGWQWMSANGSSPCPNPAFRCKTEVNWLADIRAKLGYGFDHFLVYGAGGVSFGEIKAKATPNPGGFSDSKTQTGWNIGGGLDYAVTDNIIVGVEYKYTDLGKASFNGNAGTHVNDKVTFNTVSARVSYKFNPF